MFWKYNLFCQTINKVTAKKKPVNKEQKSNKK